jgi:hypothetical protein
MNIYPVTENSSFYRAKMNIACPPLYMETGTDPFAEIWAFSECKVMDTSET